MPHHICVNRDGLPEGQDPEGFIETEDYVEVDGEHFSPSLCFPRHLCIARCLPQLKAPSPVVKGIFQVCCRCMLRIISCMRLRS